MTQTQLKGEEVEAGGLCACWWLELRPKKPSGLELGAFLSVDPEHSYIDLPSRPAVTLLEFKDAVANVVAVTLLEFKDAVANVVDELQIALETDSEFIEAIETARGLSTM